MSVDEFAKGLLGSVGVRLGKTSKIECFTEIVFQNKDKNASKIRPDGLIIVTTGKKQWLALVESKIGKAELQIDQMEAYLDLAKEHKIDAFITLSNQFATIPTILDLYRFNSALFGVIIHFIAKQRRMTWHKDLMMILSGRWFAHFKRAGCRNGKLRLILGLDFRRSASGWLNSEIKRA